MVGEMKEYICSDRDRCPNEKCLYRKDHTSHEHIPFHCSYIKTVQHCELVNKEGIMEDNRKGTWEDVTGECTVDDTGIAGFVEVRHDGVTVGWLGHRVESSKFQENYRMTSSLDPEDARDGNCGAFMVEHFIPDPEPEWVDVTDDCVVETSSNQGGLCARVSHRGNALAFLGTKVSDWTSDRNGYRLIAWPATGGESGGIRIEKQND